MAKTAQQFSQEARRKQRKTHTVTCNRSVRLERCSTLAVRRNDLGPAAGCVIGCSNRLGIEHLLPAIPANLNLNDSNQLPLERNPPVRSLAW
jgi:hypothetical protein